MPRPNAQDRGYTGAWQKASKVYLAHHPYCVPCQAHGKTTRATLVDHIKPHKGDRTLFWDKKNWQGLCVSCDGDKRALERSGKHQYSGGSSIRGCHIDGTPLDPAHAWRNKQPLTPSTSEQPKRLGGTGVTIDQAWSSSQETTLKSGQSGIGAERRASATFSGT